MGIVELAPIPLGDCIGGIDPLPSILIRHDMSLHSELGLLFIAADVGCDVIFS